VTTAAASAGSQRSDVTRERILDTAERLFAENGVAAVSSRQISEAAGQSNKSAVAYHFGTKSDLVLAIVRSHREPTEQRRLEMIGALDGTADLYDWGSCLVRPLTERLSELGNPTWYARFNAQITTDPALRQLVVSEGQMSPSIQQTLDGIHALMPVLPERVRQARSDLVRHVIVHSCAEREGALQEAPAAQLNWTTTANELIDAIVGLWLAPVTSYQE
jgi:AcrR family transcriptional regulator